MDEKAKVVYPWLQPSLGLAVTASITPRLLEETVSVRLDRLDPPNEVRGMLGDGISDGLRTNWNEVRNYCLARKGVKAKRRTLGSFGRLVYGVDISCHGH